MALPVTIDTGLDVTISGGLGSDTFGPFFSSAGAVYAIAPQSNIVGGISPKAYKATDPTSSFSAVATCTTALAFNAIACRQDGDLVHVVTQRSVGNRDVQYHLFNMATDTWDVADENVTSPGATAVVRVGVGIGVRSSGSVFVVYSGMHDVVSMNNWARVKGARRDSGVWTVDIAVDSGGSVTWGQATLVPGSSDRMHIFFQDHTNSDGYHRTFKSDNAFGTAAAYDTAVNGNCFIGPGVAYDSSGTTKVRMPFLDSTDKVSVVNFDSADTPTLAVDADVSDTTVAVQKAGWALAANGTTLYLIYSDASRDIWIDSNADGAGWGTDVEILDAVTCNILSANVYTRQNQLVLAYIYDDAGTVKYNEYLLVQFERTLARRLELGLARGLA